MRDFANSFQGVTLSPPDEAQAEEFKIAYNPEYWGTEAKIYGTFGKGNLRGVMSMLILTGLGIRVAFLLILFVLPKQRFSTMLWQLFLI